MLMVRGSVPVIMVQPWNSRARSKLSIRPEEHSLSHLPPGQGSHMRLFSDFWYPVGQWVIHCPLYGIPEYTLFVSNFVSVMHSFAVTQRLSNCKRV